MSVKDTLLYTIAAALVGLIAGAYLNYPDLAVVTTLIACTACIVAAIGGRRSAPKDGAREPENEI